MNTPCITSTRYAFLILLLFCGSSAQVNAAQLLTFEGLGNGEGILEFYNGGTGSFGSGPGQNYGISFLPGALTTIDSDVLPGSGGDFANEPSPDTIAFFDSDLPTLVMNVPAGFQTGFSFFYTTTPFDSGLVTVYDGLNATGAVLATVVLDPTFCCTNGDPTGNFDTWVPVGVAFSGTAKSVDFSGAANQIGFDNITLGSETPGVPEPSTLVLAVLAIVGVVCTQRAH